MNHLILAIDTSCDDTSAAVTQGTVVYSNVVASQTELHKPFGGVFPTVAKQAHKENIDRVVALALKRAGVTMAEISAVAVTQGPGLAPALEVGITKAKALASEFHKPLIAVNHIEAHALSPLARARGGAPTSSNSPRLPALAVVISGGHSLFILVKAIGEYEVLGTTIDDAAGECLDKVGRLVNLGYPAGPVIEKFAKLGNPKAYPLPLPMTHIHDFNLSFSGLKTHARTMVERLTQDKPLGKQEVYDFCASIQYAVFRHICYKLSKILSSQQIHEVWLGGGVSANVALRTEIRRTIREHERELRTRKESQRNASVAHTAIRFRAPYTKRLCIDNAAMIGVVAGWKLERGEVELEPEKVDRKPRLSLKK